VYVVTVEVMVVDVAVIVVVVVVAVVVVLDVAVVVLVLVVRVLVIVVHALQRPGQLDLAASEMNGFGFSQFFNLNPGIKQPSGSAIPLQVGSVQLWQMTGHWIRMASPGPPTASHRCFVLSQIGASGSPLQAGVVVVVVVPVLVVVVVVVGVVVVVVDIVVVVAVVVVVVSMQVRHNTGQSLRNCNATSDAALLQREAGSLHCSTGSSRPLHFVAFVHDPHKTGHTFCTSRPIASSFPQNCSRSAVQNSSSSSIPLQVGGAGHLLQSTGQDCVMDSPSAG
jgi:hypothetical protein